MDYKKDSLKFLAGSVLIAFLLYFFIYYCLFPPYSKLYLLSYLNRHLSMEEIKNLIVKNYSFIFFHMKIKDDLVVSAAPYFTGFVILGFFSAMIRVRYGFVRPWLGVALYYSWAAFIGMPSWFLTLSSPFVMSGFPLRYKVLAVLYFVILIVLAAWVSEKTSDVSVRVWKRVFSSGTGKKAAIGLTAALLAAVLASCLYAYVVIPLGTPPTAHWPDRRFSSVAWKAAPMTGRYVFYRNLAAGKSLDSLSRNGVYAVLGKPDSGSAGCRYALYVLKWDRTGVFGFDRVYTLKIRFDHSCMVKDYEVRQW